MKSWYRGVQFNWLLTHCQGTNLYTVNTYIYIYIPLLLAQSDYGLDGPGIESRWVEIFRTRPDRPWGPSSLLYNGYRVSSGGKVAGAWRDHPPTSSAEVKERVELYLYSPSGPSWPFLGWPLPLPLTWGPYVCCIHVIVRMASVLYVKEFFFPFDVLILSEHVVLVLQLQTNSAIAPKVQLISIFRSIISV
jgi:hypothetical protein